MHEIHETLSPGAVIRDRYLVIDLLGTGGFSAVYLVQDQQREDRYFALKEVIATNKHARERFTFECTLLERLVHPALPQVYSVFDNEEHDRLYMLMDYVEGPNLETLRHIQPEQRFSLAVITVILAPVVDAIEYLHRQYPPIIHRDIKPSNMIVPIVGGKTILVDFGIAKEYDTQGTTSAVRHCSPGYGAPEHYTTGTNTRTDIYGLGATLYTLLTGDIPPDAIERMTEIGNDKPDPLRPACELVPSIPQHISKAIEQAMSINMMHRFATVQEFWQALQGTPAQQLHISEALNSIIVSPSTSKISTTTGEPSSRPLQEEQWPRSRSRKRSLLPAFLIFLALLIIGGIGASFWGFTVFERNYQAAPAAGRSTATFNHLARSPIANATVLPTHTATFTPGLYSHLAASYAGTIDNLQEQTSSTMTLTHMLQNNEHISGIFSAMHISKSYSGILDTAKHIYFTVPASSNAPLYFTGAVRADGNLVGTFCQIDKGGQCTSNGEYGLWSVAPATAP